VSHPNNQAAESFARLWPWICYVLAASLLLRPILITTVFSDDLLNPFSQIYHAGTSIDAIMRRTWSFIPVTGHFNYVGQTIGSVVVMIWTYLMGNFGIRFSAVYATTKFLVYLFCFVVSAAAIRSALSFIGIRTSAWSARIWVLIAITFTLQIHIPWSNDPVSSYPLSGFLTTAIGILFIVFVFSLHDSTSLIRAFAVGVVGVFAVLYYEYNSFAIFSTAPIILYSFWGSLKNKKVLIHRVKMSFLSVGPAAFTTVYFYLSNRAASANYNGTALSFKAPFAGTFVNGVAGTFPATSWKIAHEWLTASLARPAQSWLPYFLGIAVLGSLYPLRNNWDSQQLVHKVKWQRVLIGCIPFVIYWLGAIFTQASTEKVQLETTRLGQVYNFYAVGVTCLAIILIILLSLVNWKKTPVFVRSGLFATVLFFGAYQHVINWNVMIQFNGATSGSRNLLVAYAEKPSMESRCAALNSWKTMGWPEYYWLDMELGLNASYEIFHGELFCKQ
jgi:hypothetical protein